jgi:tetratricopeptide (TPR) repeat protein
MKQSFAFLLALCFTPIFAQHDVIEEATSLIAEKKYESAYHLLYDADPENRIPDLAIAKTELLLDYFVSSIMHQLFALKDLEPGEDISKIRGSNDSYAMFNFAPDSVLSSLIENHPEDYSLRKALGYFYHEVHLKYPQTWLEPDSIVIDRFYENYSIAYDHDVYDHWSAYGIGYACLMKQDFASAIPYLKRSTELKKDYPTSHYNLAYAYLYTDQREKGIESAKTAMELYDLPHLKADAARMIGVMYRELGDQENALDYYRQAHELQPSDYYTLKPLLDLELSLNKETYPERTKEFFLVAPGNPTIYQDLMTMYWINDKPDELLAFLSSQHETFMADPKVNGNLYFYEALIQFDKQDFIQAEASFEKSRKIFRDLYEPDHRVFEVIDSYTSEL